MAKDYAKRVINSSRKTNTNRWRTFFIVIFIVSFLAFLFCWIVLHKTKSASGENSFLARAKMLMTSNTLGINKPVEAIAHSLETTSDQENIHFDFYL